MLESPSGGKVAASQLPGNVSRFSPQREHGFCREERRHGGSPSPFRKNAISPFGYIALQDDPYLWLELNYRCARH
jgi:hypothetical protein